MDETLTSLLAEAKEFVEHLSNEEQSDENFARTDMYVSPADRLRQEAILIEQHDELIYRARQLLPKIEKALMEKRTK